MHTVLACIAASLVFLWGVAHAISPKQAAASFEPITRDNRLVITQEWLPEAFTMWGVAAIVAGVIWIEPDGSGARDFVYRAAAVLLVVASLA